MTCPNCYCAECQKERARWSPQRNFQPYMAIPNNTGPAGYWLCSGCGALHPPGYVCLQVKRT